MVIKNIKNIDTLNITDFNQDNIYLFTQFYISPNKDRYNEIKTCLKKNIELGVFTKIYLINERSYTQEEMGLNDEEIKNVQQIIFDKGVRMKYMHPLGIVKAKKINGYIVISNSDIFFDNTISNIRKTSISQIKSLYALLRFEYKNENKLGDCKLFGPRNDSQDTWIFHSKYLPTDNQIIRCNFTLGKAGCDNAIAYLFNEFGFKIFNEPKLIKTYHYHLSSIRTYTQLDRIHPPYLLINPNITNI
jgi:hypothetical protein